MSSRTSPPSSIRLRKPSFISMSWEEGRDGEEGEEERRMGGEKRRGGWGRRNGARREEKREEKKIGGKIRQRGKIKVYMCQTRQYERGSERQ